MPLLSMSLTYRLLSILQSGFKFAISLVLTGLTYGILFRARHIPGGHNPGAHTFQGFRSSSSKKSRAGRKNCQRQLPPTFCLRIGPYAEGFLKFGTIVGHTQTLPANFGYFYCSYPTIIFILISSNYQY